MSVAGRNFLRLGMVGILLATSLLVLEPAARAVPDASGIIIDDFEDGDASDWQFFGGNAAGGGGGAAADRPYEGAHYLSTGWGGAGTASGFYGGAFRNFDDAAQVVPPTDPWFNVWVLNQSDATVDAYTFEVTLREDLDGNGWTNGAEDSFGLDTTFSSASFDDEWVLVSAPLSSFFDRGTGGNGVFDGALDEIVIVMGGVSGASPSVIEVDFDLFTFSSGGPVAFDEVVFDDMEHGAPPANGWFSFNGSVGGGGIGPNTSDVPPSGGGFSLETGWGSGGTPGFYGGFGRSNPVDASGTDHFNLWINPDAGQEYTLEINLQDDDSGNETIENADDDEFQYNCVVGPTGPCAVAGGGWQLVSIPLDDFFDDNSFVTGGNGILDPTATDRGGNGVLVNVVVAVIGTGSDVNFRTDDWTLTRGPAVAPPVVGGSDVFDDFEGGVPSGVVACDPTGPPLGFCTFEGAGSSVDVATGPEPEPIPGGSGPNDVLSMTVDATSFAGFIHGFEGTSADGWAPRDWSTSEGLSFWMYGANSGATVFVDVLDNRNPGSTTDDAERWTVSFTDDFSGWQLEEFPFSSFVRKEVGNGAPNDGFGLFEIHGYAIGTLDTGGPIELLVDDVALYGVAEPPAVAVQLVQQNTLIGEGTTGDVAVKLNRPLGPDDPAEVSIDFATERSNAVPGEDYLPTSGMITFVRGGPSELAFPVETFDNTKFEGDKQVVIRLTNPIGADRGFPFQGSVLIQDDDPFDPKLLDDFEQGAFLWDSVGPATIEAVRSASGDPGARPGQDAVENVGLAAVPVFVEAEVQGKLCVPGNGAIPVTVLTTPTFDATAIDHTTVTLGAASEVHVDKKTGLARRHEEDVDNDGDMDLVFHFRSKETGLDCGSDSIPVNGQTFDGQAITTGGSGAALVHDFPIGQDWTGTESISFWYLGAGGGQDVTVTLKDNRAPDPGPSGWDLVWSDEFDGSAGTPPDLDNWSYELGDTTPDGKNGWGNEELQYYTDDNAATDGLGNLVIILDEADGSQECYYGPCEFESARLITQNKAEFAYGRVESRLQVPDGGDGLWPAFWSLGTDITYNPWPGAGEIDIMEYVSRLPDEAFGTIHGPGYSGGGSFGGIYDFGEPVDEQFHTFAVEWEPNLITWYVDDIQYHQAEPSDVAGPWVFEKPFFLLLNFAIGGNFGGDVDPANAYPQDYLVDYVRVYQGPDTAERFEATFTDSAEGWREVSIPIADFLRSDDQPAGAPDDGLTLSEVWGYGLEFDAGTATGRAGIDLVRRVSVPSPTDLAVTNLDDSGPGSLREALGSVADGGTITFDPSLTGGTVTLSSGQLTIDRGVTLDASGAAPMTISGGDASRVFEVAAGVAVEMAHLVIRDGVAAPQGGGILNRGSLVLDHVVVTDNIENSVGPANFAFGGGGVYNADYATFRMIDSTVSDNTSVNQPAGGIYGSFGSTVEIIRSTVSGNLSGDVAGGLRSLGDSTVLNSTFSANTSTAWHGGGIFHTDGSLTVTNSTFADNVAPAGTASGILVATFGAPADMTIANSIVQGFGGAFACAIEGGGAATITSAGTNVISDGSCNPDLTDQASTDALLGPLVDNGGPTLTHALSPASPAIDAAGAAACPAVDQRGVARPIGAGCDVGAFELDS